MKCPAHDRQLGGSGGMLHVHTEFGGDQISSNCNIRTLWAMFGLSQFGYTCTLYMYV